MVNASAAASMPCRHTALKTNAGARPVPDDSLNRREIFRPLCCIAMGRIAPVIAVCFSAGLAVVLPMPGAQADPIRPFILFDTGVSISTNEFSDHGIRYPLRWLIDDDPRTTWVFESTLGSSPEIRIAVPDGQSLDALDLINGYAKSAALYRMNNIITGLSVRESRDDAALDHMDNLFVARPFAVAGDREALRFDLERSMDRQSIAFDGTVEGSIVVRVDEVIAGERYDDTCISELDVVSGGRSLFDASGYIATDGGEYPAYSLYRDGGMIAEFPGEAVDVVFFIEDGRYAVFVHPPEMWSNGATVYNMATGEGEWVLQDVMIVPGSLLWRDGRFEGRLMAPPSMEETAFSRAVALP